MAAVKAVHPSAAQLFPAASVGQALRPVALPQALAASWCYQQQLRHKLATVIASVGAFVGTNVCMLQVSPGNGRWHQRSCERLRES